MAQFRVIADKIWHSGECKHYYRGEVVNLPDTTVVKEGGSIEPIKPAKEAKGKGTKGESPEGDEALA